MPITANIILPALSALGSSGKKYGASGNTKTPLRLPYMRASGAAYYHANGALVIGSQVRIAGTMLLGELMGGNLTLEYLIVAGGSGAGGALTLEQVTATGTGTVTPWANGALVLKQVLIAGSGIAGVVATGKLTLPNATTDMRIGSHGELVLSPATTAGSVSTMEGTTGVLRLPFAVVTGNISIFSLPGGGNLVLLPVIAGPYGIGRLTLPYLIVSGGQALTTTDFEGWLMNVRNKGVTRFTAFPFTQFATVNNKTYAIGSGGLYLLGGNTDNGNPIVWQFETGLSDFGRPGLKHLPYLYLDGIIDGEVEIVLIDDRRREFAYHYDTKQRGAVHLKHRRKLGNGIRTTNAAFRIKSDTGAYIELDALEPEVTITQRSI